MKRPHTLIGITRRLAGPAAAVLLGMALTPMLATPANAEAAVGYVRLAHLSPDTPNFKEVLLTSERTDAPKTPGTVVLRARLVIARPATGGQSTTPTQTTP